MLARVRSVYTGARVCRVRRVPLSGCARGLNYRMPALFRLRASYRGRLGRSRLTGSCWRRWRRGAGRNRRVDLGVVGNRVGQVQRNPNAFAEAVQDPDHAAVGAGDLDRHQLDMVVVTDDRDVILLVAYHQRRCRHFDVTDGGDQQRDVDVTAGDELALAVVEIHFRQQRAGARIELAADAADLAFGAAFGIRGIHDLY